MDGLHTSGLSYWVEPEGDPLSWQQVLAHAQWHEHEGEFNLGYAHKKVWVSQDIHSFKKDNWVLQVPYPLLDYVDIYIINAGLNPDNNAGVSYPLYEQQRLATEDQ